MKVHVTRELPGTALDRLRAAVDEVEVWPGIAPPPASTIMASCRDADALISMLTDRVDTTVLDGAPRLRVIANVAVGHDNIDVAACAERGIVVTNTPDVLARTTAELTMALILATTRRLVEASDAVREGAWQDWHPGWMLGRDLAGSQLGIVGMGAIGNHVARMAAGFEMEVVHHNRTSGIALDELLSTSDVVSLHVPLTDATTALIGARELALMKPTAILINMARGGVVDTSALIASLRDGTIRAAGLDVTPVEPLPTDHELLALPNCIVLPHIGSASVATRERMADLAVDNVLAVLRGDAPLTPVTP